MTRFVPRHLFHLYDDDLVGGLFSLSSFTVEQFHFHEYPKYENYCFVYGDLKISIKENTRLTMVAMDLQNGFPLYPLVFRLENCIEQKD
uniref:Uncharacterized protein n=1 Tax=Lactuca sativa TaxID=4236 RepID=A0A9R1VDU5_LACSA|nr:hypothetical protein LSAT_V11C500240250 [Lactuca sativa]